MREPFMIFIAKIDNVTLDNFISVQRANQADKHGQQEIEREMRNSDRFGEHFSSSPS
jgi:hypothetical protein